jgi:density-regulated protein DRP1
MPKREKKEKKDKRPKEDEEEDEDEEEEGKEEEEKEEEKPKADKEAKEDATVDAKEDAKEDKKEEFSPPPRIEVKFEFKAHDSYPPMEGPVTLEYCPICSLPPDFCEYGPCWEKCKPWCLEHYPHYYPQYSGVSLEDAKKGAEAASEKGKVKELPGGKKKRETSPHVTIKKLTRGGRKCVTSVFGLEGFDVKLDAVTKAFKTRFACGCSVVKGENGLPDSVDIQGDFEDEVVDQLVDKFKIPEEKISVAAGGTKKAGKKK